MNTKTFDLGISRRAVLKGGSLLTAAMLVPGVAFAAAGHIAVKSVRFKNGVLDLAGNLYLPKGVSESGTYPAIVSIHHRTVDGF
jgi:dipeptidyl aminopeptidase/acylaminoacyl peptidase